jgi:hypothetical protein
METSTQILSQEKRQSKSKECVIQFVKATEDFAYYNVLDEDNSIKYIGRIEKVQSLNEYCSCPDQFHRNNKVFRNEHGYSLQCKHMIQAVIKRGWNCW